MEEFFIFHHIAQSVRTHQYDVSPLQTVLIKVYVHIRFRPDRPCDDILIRVVLGLLRLDASQPHHFLHKRMVLRELLDPLIDQIQTAVSYIGKNTSSVHDRRRNYGCPHPLEVFVAGRLLDDLPVGCLDRRYQAFLHILTLAHLQLPPEHFHRIF